MNGVHGTHKASKLAAEDVISSMPDNVITNIMNRLPIRDAVGTSILARNWRLKWTLLTQLVFEFDEDSNNGDKVCGSRILSRILLQLKGPITKFSLFIGDGLELDDEDLSAWVLFLSRKGIKEFIIANMHDIPIKLPKHLFSCLELTHMKLGNCFFHPPPTFCGFPNLLGLDLRIDHFEIVEFGELITQCPLLEILRISYVDSICKVTPTYIQKLENLKELSLRLDMLENMVMTTSSIFQLVGFLPKLENLYLDFEMCEFVAEAVATKQFSTIFPCLRALTLSSLDFGSNTMLSCASEMIWGSPKLQSLHIVDTFKNAVLPPTLGFLELDCSTMGYLQLQSVRFSSFSGSKTEICLIKYILARSPLLKRITINLHLPLLAEKWEFARELLKLHRASPVAEVVFD